MNEYHYIIIHKRYGIYPPLTINGIYILQSIYVYTEYIQEHVSIK